MDRNAEGCLRLLVTAVALFPDELRSSAPPPPNHSISQLVSQQDLARPKVHNIRSDMLHDDASKQPSHVATLSHCHVATLSYVLRLQFWSPRPPTWRQRWSRQPVLGSSFGRLGSGQRDRRCWSNLRLHGLDLQVGRVEGQQGGSDVLHQLVLVHRLHLVQVEHFR